MSEKSLILTYIFWLFGGFLGLHHFYLRRYIQSFLYFCLPGGYFGAGWLRDFWRIPEYVRDANNDSEYLGKLSNRMRAYEKPPLQMARTCGQLVVGNLFGVLIMIALPEKSNFGIDFSLLHKVLSPLFCAIGIWLVGNIGREKGALLWPILGCYALLPFYLLGYSNHAFTTIAGIAAFHWKSRQWRRQQRRRFSRFKIMLILGLFGGLYVSMWGSYAYFNMKVRTKDGDEIHIRDAVGNFLKSPAVQEFSKNLGKLFHHMKEFGFMSTLQQLIDSLDPLGEKNALKILDLPRNATQENIKMKYRELTKKWHPDRQKDEEKKAEAQDKFVEIQQAYEKLSQIKKNRLNNNKKFVYNDDERVEL